MGLEKKGIDTPTIVKVSGETLSLPATQVVKISGDTVSITSGQTVQLPSTQVVKISGDLVGITSGQFVQLPATQVVKTSGEQVVVASGAVIHRELLSGLQTIIGSISGVGVILPVTQVVKVSGEKLDVTLNSGYVGAVALTDDAGATIAYIGQPLADGLAGTLITVFQTAYVIGYDEAANKWNRIRVNKSGQGALVVATSGSDYIITNRATSAVILASGLGTSNTYTYSGTAFTGKDTATLVVDYLGTGSGVSYRIRGHAITNIAPAIIGSGVVTGSGSQATLTVAGVYQYIDVGLASLQTNFSGSASAILATQ